MEPTNDLVLNGGLGSDQIKMPQFRLGCSRVVNFDGFRLIFIKWAGTSRMLSIVILGYWVRCSIKYTYLKGDSLYFNFH